jgi:hypothetical protein
MLPIEASSRDSILPATPCAPSTPHPICLGNFVDRQLPAMLAFSLRRPIPPMHLAFAPQRAARTGLKQ